MLFLEFFVPFDNDNHTLEIFFAAIFLLNKILLSSLVLNFLLRDL